jgi:hypothetical protein
MNNISHLLLAYLLSASSFAAAQTDTLQLNLDDAIRLAQLQSVDAAVALNELKTAYWEYRSFYANQLPEVNFTGTLPAPNAKSAIFRKANSCNWNSMRYKRKAL